MPATLNTIRIIAVLLASGIFVGCAKTHITTSSYRDQPIEVSEAEEAIRNSGLVEKVWKERWKIKFEGNNCEGELFHGTEGEPFTDYGMDVNFGFGLSKEECMVILDTLTEDLYPDD